MVWEPFFGKPPGKTSPASTGPLTFHSGSSFPGPFSRNQENSHELASTGSNFRYRFPFRQKTGICRKVRSIRNSRPSMSPGSRKENCPLFQRAGHMAGNKGCSGCAVCHVPMAGIDIPIFSGRGHRCFGPAKGTAQKRKAWHYIETHFHIIKEQGLFLLLLSHRRAMKSLTPISHEN